MKLKSVFRLKTNVKRQHSFMDSHQNGKQSCPLALMIQQAGRLTQFSKVGNTLNDKLRLIFFATTTDVQDRKDSALLCKAFSVSQKQMFYVL